MRTLILGTETIEELERIALEEGSTEFETPYSVYTVEQASPLKLKLQRDDLVTVQ
jgi:hypothetical protein